MRPIGGETFKVDTIIDVFYNFKTPLNLKIFQKSMQNKFRYSNLFDNSNAIYKDISLRDKEFDNEFIVKGDNEKIAMDFITMDIKNKLLNYKHIKPGIIFRRDKFTIKIAGTLKKDEEYDELINVAIMFCDRLKELKI